MLHSIKGKILNIENKNILIEIGNFVFSFLTVKPERLEIEKEYFLKTVFIWNSENGPSIYCFLKDEEVVVFNLLLSCPGIGPKMALGILNFLEIEELVQSIELNDPKIISKTPGIGIKKAEIIVTKLKNEIKKVINYSFNNLNLENNYKKDLYNALNSLGYKNNEIFPAIREVEKENKFKDRDFSQILTEVLSKIGINQ